jgi:hypothetical protein
MAAMCGIALQSASNRATFIVKTGAPASTKLGAKESFMAKIVQMGARKLPTMLGAGILSISVVGLAAAAIGASLTVGAEVLVALVGMALGSRYA